MVPYTYYRLVESYRDAEGRTRQRTVVGLGELLELPSEEERRELARVLTEMIRDGMCSLCENGSVYDMAVGFYGKYLEERAEARLREDRLAEEARKHAEREREAATLVRMKSLQPEQARSIGAEHVCNKVLERLGLRRFLKRSEWSDLQADVAVAQIIMRAVYPSSELRTVRCLRENSAVCEMFGLDPGSVTKDTLYGSALRLYGLHRELEDFLHDRVCDMFSIEEKVYLFDLTNTYFEGRMEHSGICRYGRSKEKRSDCKIVALAAVVNTDGLLVRTEIFEGNRQDVTTLEDVLGSLGVDGSGRRRVVVMDAGFHSASNIAWLKSNGYDYITVMRSSGAAYTPAGEPAEVRDNKGQSIRLQRVSVAGSGEGHLLVDSDARMAKERGMYERATQHVEEELEKMRRGIAGRGTKKRDKLQQRLGKINTRYHGFLSAYTIEFDYDGKQNATAMRWHRNDDSGPLQPRSHGKYLLQTSLDDSDEVNVWTFYNVIRTVEETFKTLKLDLDIRPVYHKTDAGTKAHLHLAVLAYWVVSTAKFILRQHGINVRWSELLRIMSTQQRVTVTGERADGRKISVRKSTTPEKKLSDIHAALGIPAKASCPIKFVWPQKQPPENDPNSHSAT